jgi:hypothetical protein
VVEQYQEAGEIAKEAAACAEAFASAAAGYQAALMDIHGAMRVSQFTAAGNAPSQEDRAVELASRSKAVRRACVQAQKAQSMLLQAYAVVPRRIVAGSQATPLLQALQYAPRFDELCLRNLPTGISVVEGAPFQDLDAGRIAAMDADEIGMMETAIGADARQIAQVSFVVVFRLMIQNCVLGLNIASG